MFATFDLLERERNKTKEETYSSIVSRLHKRECSLDELPLKVTRMMNEEWNALIAQAADLLFLLSARR